MKNVIKFLLQPRAFLNGTILEYSTVSLVFILLTFIFTDWVVLDISNALFIEAAGDGTSGFLWLLWADQDLSPILGFTDLVNYPDGIELGNPVMVTYSALWLPMWLLARLFNPVAALNLVTLWGIFGAAMSTYWLTKRITSNVWVSFFAGFAVAFVPYHIVKSSSHLAYIFSMVFVLIIAAFIGIWRRPNLIRALIFAATIALAFYTDGYFILLATALVFALIGGGILYEIIQRSSKFWARIWLRAKYFLVAIIAVIIFISPIAFVQLKYGKDVNSNLAQARGDVTSELYFYAAKPIDYLVPALRHPLLEKVPEFIQLQSVKNSRSNPSENTLYIGYVVMLLTVIGFCLTATYVVRRKDQTLNKLPVNQRNAFLLVASLTAVAAPFLFLFSMSPQVGVAGISIPLPGQILVTLDISFWRVLARFFMPLHVILSIFAALSLWVLFITYKKNNTQAPIKPGTIQAAICIFLVLIMGLEYATLTNRPHFSFNSVPPAYHWLKRQDGINAVVEFPFVGRPWDPAVNAVTSQILHGKKVLNLHISQQSPGQRNAFVSVDNPEAIDFVVQRGADLAITREQPCDKTAPWLNLVYDGSKDKGYTLVCIYELSAVSNDRLFANLKGGFLDVPYITKSGDFYNVMYGNYAEIWVMNSQDEFVAESTPALFTATLVNTPLKPSFTGDWRVLQDEVVIAQGQISDGKAVALEANVDTSKPIQIRMMGSDGQSPQVGQLSLQDIVITEQ